MAKCDSKLVISQITGIYQAKDNRIKAHLKLVQVLQQSFAAIIFKQIPRVENSHADALASYGSPVKDPSTKMSSTDILRYPPYQKNHSDFKSFQLITSKKVGSN